MPILITGVTGYLGKVLINEYRHSDYKLILTFRKKTLDNINTNNVWKKFNLYLGQKDIFNYFEKPKTLIHLAWDGLHHRDYN